MNTIQKEKKYTKSNLNEFLNNKGSEAIKKADSEIRDGFYNFKRIWGDLLPPPHILESYEEAAPGIVKKFGDILKIEQQHRHKLERKFYRAMARSILIGQFLTLFIAAGIIYATILLVQKYQAYLAGALLGGCGFLFLVVVNVIGILVRGKAASYFPEHDKNNGAEKLKN